MRLSAGTTLGPYEILALMGAGGMGEVYRARDSKLSREVALKVLAPEFVSDTIGWPASIIKPVYWPR
jgi:serine/threonine protein kinase